MLGVLTVSFAVMQRLVDARPERTPRERPPTVYPIETVTAEIGENRPTLRAFGEVVAGRSIDLRAPSAGEIIRVSPSLRPGLKVEEGDELLAIDDFDARTALTEARSALAEAAGSIAETEARIAAEQAQIGASEEQERLAREDLERTDRLVQRGTVPASQRDQKRVTLSQAEQSVITRRTNLDVQRAQLETQRSQIERLELRVEQAERAVADTVVIAPFDGIVRSTIAEVGREVTPSETMATLYDDGDLEVRFVLTDAQFGRLATDREPLVGRPVEVTWTIGGEPLVFDAEVERVGADIATERGGVEIFAGIDIEDGEDSIGLRPGAFVELSMPDRTFDGTMRLPETALYDERDVYVNVDGRLERRSVLRLAFDGEEVIVRPQGEAPLVSGERVMVTRISRVDDGLNVREPNASDAPATPRRGGEGRDELLAEVAAANEMTVEELRAMPVSERRALVRAHRGQDGTRGGNRAARGAARRGTL